jgi:hypothetical protein
MAYAAPMSIPGVAVFHPRTEWEQDGYRMATDFTRLPTRIRLSNVDQMVAHYTGAKNMPDGDPGEDMTKVRDVLRAVERDYLTNRVGGGYTRISDNKYFPGYHTGYSFAIDWEGGVWEIRGLNFLPAATNRHNDHTIAVLFLTDADDPATPAQWASARAIGQYVRLIGGHAGFHPYFTDHGTLTITSGQGTATACSGKGIRGQLTTEGNLDKAGPAPTPEPTPEPPGDDDMKWSKLTITEAGAIFMGWSDGKVFPEAEWVNGDDPDQLQRYLNYEQAGFGHQVEISFTDLKGVCLIGSVPERDDKFSETTGQTWGSGHFGKVVGYDW